MLTQQTDFPCTLLADSDLHFDPTWLTDRQCPVGIGHNEYWSLDMREQLQTHLSGGGSFANFAGNTCWWQMCYAPGPSGSSLDLHNSGHYVAPTGDPTKDRMIVGYKFDDNAALTTKDPAPDAWRWSSRRPIRYFPGSLLAAARSRMAIHC